MAPFWHIPTLSVAPTRTAHGAVGRSVAGSMSSPNHSPAVNRLGRLQGVHGKADLHLGMAGTPAMATTTWGIGGPGLCQTSAEKPSHAANISK